MNTKTKWVERKFEYQPPLGEFPCLLARLRGTPSRLDEMALLLPRDVLTRRQGDNWSIQEQIGHLLDVEELLDGRIDDFLAAREVLRPADMSNTRTRQRHHNERDIRDLLASFRAVRMGIVARLEAMPEEVAARTALHPRLQKTMRVVDMAFFFAEHDDHHIATIIELLRNQTV